MHARLAHLITAGLLAPVLFAGALACCCLYRPPVQARAKPRLDLHTVRPLRPWRMVIIHHSATQGGNAVIFDAAHKRRGWDGLGYHFVIGNGHGSKDGQIEVGWRWRQQRKGAHCHGHNDAIGVCLVGRFGHGKLPTAKQVKALERLLRALEHVCGRELLIRRHCDFAPTQCPGFRIRVIR